MPKHVPSFKHLIATSNSRREVPQDRERTVNDRLNASRNRRRESLVQNSGSSADHAWNAFASGNTTTPTGEGPIHPAELLRRSQVAHRQASRSVAGPAPPPSWRAAPATEEEEMTKTEVVRSFISSLDLRTSCELFTRKPREETIVGAKRLADACFMSILRYLNSSEEFADGIILGDIMRDQVCYLSRHLKTDMLDANSLLPPGHPARMTDKSLKALLYLPTMDERGEDWEEDDIDEDWTDASETVHHLPLLLHPSPASFLRIIPSLPVVALTSVNLAYSTLSDVDRLVTVLPPTLRELGLCGVRFKGEARLANGDIWRRGLAALARKLIVLTMLDLSDPPFAMGPQILASMFHPPTLRFPSLRILGLRNAIRNCLPERNGTAAHGFTDGSPVGFKRRVAEVVRGQGRPRYVDIVW